VLTRPVAFTVLLAVLAGGPSFAQPGAGSGARPRLSVRSADGRFELRGGLLVHADGRAYADEGEPGPHSTLEIYRLRPSVGATLFGIVEARVVPDFGLGQAVVKDADVVVRLHPAFGVRLGKSKSPFGLERLVAAAALTFVYRGLPSGLVPNRATGVQVFGDVLPGRRLSYAMGLVSGVVDGGSIETGEDAGRDLVGRLFAHPFRGSGEVALERLGVGFAASHGTRRGTTASPRLPSFRTAGRETFAVYRSDGDDAAYADGDHQRWSPQGYYYAGPVGLWWETVVSTQEVRSGDATARIRNHSWQVAGAWALTGERQSYDGLAPGDPLTNAVELMIRYGELTLGEAAFPLFVDSRDSAREAQETVVGVSWHRNRTVKVVLNYARTRFRTEAGGADRPTEHGLFLRLQVVL